MRKPRKGNFFKPDLEHLVHRIGEDGLLFAVTEYSDWDDFDGTDLGDALKSFQFSRRDLEEKIQEACDEKNVPYGTNIEETEEAKA